MAANPYVIVFGNEKGGTGKSTAAMHVIAALLKQGATVGSIDVDARQGTLSRYVANREANPLTILCPQHSSILKSALPLQEEAEAEDRKNLEAALGQLWKNDYIVIDTPGSDTYLSRYAHTFADTLITPLNDSFIDLDMLVRLEADSLKILKPSTYAEMVWEHKKQKAIRGGNPMDWVVMRNRLTNINAKNKEQMEQVLNALAKRIGFRLAAGFGERVIFKELFLSGLTLLDLSEESLKLSHVTARQELRNLIQMLNLPTTQKVAI